MPWTVADIPGVFFGICHGTVDQGNQLLGEVPELFPHFLYLCHSQSMHGREQPISALCFFSPQNTSHQKKFSQIFLKILTAEVDLALSFCEEERATKHIQMYFLTSLSFSSTKQTHSLINNLHSLLLTPLVFEITLAVSGIPGQGKKILFIQNLNCFLVPSLLM